MIIESWKYADVENESVDIIIGLHFSPKKDMIKRKRKIFFSHFDRCISIFYFLRFFVFEFSHYLSFSQNNNHLRFLTRSFFRGLYQFFGSINITITIIILISTPMFISISITILMLIYLFMNVVATVRLWIVISYRAEHLKR